MKIELSQGQFAIVDEADYAQLSAVRWCAQWCKKTRSFIAVRNAKVLPKLETRLVLMHRQIMGLERGDKRVVDHINHDTLDNRRSNLRVCTVAQNNMNTSVRRTNKTGYKGVWLHKPTQKFATQVKIGGKIRHLGYFESAELAFAAYCSVAIPIHGEFAHSSLIAEMKEKR